MHEFPGVYMEVLTGWDISLLRWINGSHTDGQDMVWTAVTWKFTWVPLYIFLLYRLWVIEGRNIWIPLLSIVILITLSDQLASSLFKPWIQRLRPCHSETLSVWLHLVEGHCGGKFGFYSSHASNTMALALFWGMRSGKKVFILLCIWAILNAYSRIYLGVHYPSDILAGMLAGMVCAFCVLYIERYIRKYYYHVVNG